MGYDIGYHAVSEQDIRGAFDFIFDKTKEIPYLDRAITASRSRFVANSWGLGITHYSSRIMDEIYTKAEEIAKSQAPGFIGRLMGKKAPKPNYPTIDMSEHIGDFDSHVHLWGRPFLIIQDNQLVEIIDRYLQANWEESAELARQQISLLNSKILGNVIPDNKPIPDLETLKQQATWKMEILKECVQAFPNAVKDREGQEHSSVDLLNSNLNFYVLENVSLASATWMDRGLVWPSHLLAEIGIHPTYFKPFSEFYPLREALPEKAEIRQEKAISENWMVGAMIQRENLDQFKLDINKPEIIDKAKSEGWEPHCKAAIKKINECIDYAKHKNLCFVESSDVYSGPMGVIT